MANDKDNKKAVNSMEAPEVEDDSVESDIDTKDAENNTESNSETDDNGEAKE